MFPCRSAVIEAKYVLKRGKYSKPSGFTITELMTASVLLGIMIATAWSALISILETNRDSELEIDRQHELNRALDFIVDDVYSSQTISSTVTLPGPNRGLFELSNFDGSRVAYFITPKGSRRWRGPYVLYRRSSEMGKAEALVDGISASAPTCPAVAGEMVSSAGIKIFIQAASSIRVCLAGQLINHGSLTLSRRGTTRGN